MSYTIANKFALLLLLCFATLPLASGQTYTVLYSFTGGADGGDPFAGLVRDSDGNLYGTTPSDGSGGGTVYRLTPHGKLIVLHSFTGGADGGRPWAPLVQDASGNFYGTTTTGGKYGQGTIFKVRKHGNFRVLYSFTGGADGTSPTAPLVTDGAGNLYGTTYGGGDTQDCGDGCGVVFKLDRKRNLTVLYTFSSFEGGQQSTAGLVLDPSGNLYGTTNFGGDPGCGDPTNSGCGVIFNLNKDGSEGLMHAFEFPSGDYPTAGLLQDQSGNLYGTTTFGGTSQACINGCGVVFKLDFRGTETVLHNFTGGADGASPWLAPLTMDAAGNLYGTTTSGGSFGYCDETGCGVVFKLDQSGNETVLQTFNQDNPEPGFGPNGVILDSAGNLYGTTGAGGAWGHGVIFKITP